MPDLPWAAAIALGAIVAPPDAAAATAVLRSVKLPYRVLKILEGESLLNDASALLIYRVAVGAVGASSLSASHVAPALMLALIGSLVLGYICAKAQMKLTANIKDVPSSIIIQFAATFMVWILAEKLELSAILTIVVYAVTLARNVPAYTPARLRVPSYAVWETAVLCAERDGLRADRDAASPDLGRSRRTLAGTVLHRRSGGACRGDRQPHRLGHELQHGVAPEHRALRLSSPAGIVEPAEASRAVF